MVKSNHMKGVHLTGHGGFERLKFKTNLEVPKPKENEVLIKVNAAAVNNTDINTREAWYSKDDNSEDDASWSGNPIQFPRVQGADVCGRIIEVGSNKNRVGERVLIEPFITEVNGKPLEKPWYFGSECDGGFAQYTVVSDNHAYKIDSELSDIELASFPCSYSTAENLLTRAGVKQNEVVLVTGASGGVGSATVQLAKARGARVIGITGAAKRESVKELGASLTLTRNADLIKEIGHQNVDVVVDLVAGSTFSQLLDILKIRGRYATAGAVGGPHIELDVRTLYLKDLSLFGCTSLDKGVFSSLIDHIEKNDLTPVVAETYPLDSIVDAQKKFLSKKHVGKIVLEVP